MFASFKHFQIPLLKLAGRTSGRRVTPVSFQSGSGRNVLSREIESLIAIRSRCVALASALVVFALLNTAGVFWAVSGRLDVQPYVADGSVFGCSPTAVAEDAP